MDTDQPNGSVESKPKMRKVKKQVRKGDLPLSCGTSSLDESTKNAFAERENAMMMEDKLVADTEDRKNELESYIYELRGKIDDQYSEFASDEEKTKVREKLDEVEVSYLAIHFTSIPILTICLQDWLYGDGEDATKAAYSAKMDEIRFIAGPIVQRYQDKLEEERQAVLKAREEAEAAKRAAQEAAKRAEEAAKKAEEEAKKASEPATTPLKDEEMKDADTVRPDEVEEPGDSNKS